MPAAARLPDGERRPRFPEMPNTEISQVPKREQFRTLLKCSRCGAEGHAVWEENSVMDKGGPMSKLVAIPDNFLLQTPKCPQGQPVIACKGCGAVQPD